MDPPSTPTPNPQKAIAISPLILTPASIEQHPSETYRYPEPRHGNLSWKTLISSPQTNTDSLTAGIATCPVKTGHLCPHRHTQAEIYHVLEGRGVVEIDGREYPVEPGTVVYIPGNARHGIRNVSEDAELKWMYFFASDGFGDVEYRFES